MVRGANGIALFNSVTQALGCLSMPTCDTKDRPAGIATQRDGLRKRVESAKRLANVFGGPTELIEALARATGHDHPPGFTREDLVPCKRDAADLAFIASAAVS